MLWLEESTETWSTIKKIDYVNLKEVNNDVIANILQLYSPCFVPAFTLGCCPVAWAGVQ